jgi:hypothetical protein
MKTMFGLSRKFGDDSVSEYAMHCRHSNCFSGDINEPDGLQVVPSVIRRSARSMVDPHVRLYLLARASGPGLFGLVAIDTN